MSFSAYHDLLGAIHQRHLKSPKLDLHPPPVRAKSTLPLRPCLCRHSFDNLQKVTMAAAVPLQGFLVTKHMLQSTRLQAPVQRTEI